MSRLLIPGKDYSAFIPPVWSEVFDIVHMIVRTDAPQPENHYGPNGYQTFNEIHEYSRADFVSKRLYGSDVQARTRLNLLHRIENLYSQHAELWIREGCYYEHPCGAWLFSSSFQEPRKLLFTVEDTHHE